MTKVLLVLLVVALTGGPVGAQSWDYSGVYCDGEFDQGAWRVLSCPIHVHATSTRTVYLAFNTPVTQVPFLGLRGTTSGLDGTIGFLTLHSVALYPEGDKQHLIKLKVSNTGLDHYDVIVEALLPR